MEETVTVSGEKTAHLPEIIWLFCQIHFKYTLTISLLNKYSLKTFSWRNNSTKTKQSSITHPHVIPNQSSVCIEKNFNHFCLYNESMGSKTSHTGWERRLIFIFMWIINASKLCCDCKAIHETESCRHIFNAPLFGWPNQTELRAAVLFLTTLTWWLLKGQPGISHSSKVGF